MGRSTSRTERVDRVPLDTNRRLDATSRAALEHDKTPTTTATLMTSTVRARLASRRNTTMLELNVV